MRQINHIGSYTNSYKFILHLLGWLLFSKLSYDYYVEWLAQRGLSVSHASLVTYTAIQIFLTAMPVYISYFWLFPTYYLKDRYKVYVTFWGLTLTLSSLLKIEADAFFIPITPEWLRTLGHYILVQQYTIIIWIVVSWSQLMDSWKEKNKQLIEVQQAQTTAELQWLKAQIHPHFLFNVLNNIRALVYFRSDRAEDMLITLAEVMRYVLDQHTNRQVEIADEVKHIEKYVALASMKAKWEGKISLNTDISSPNLQIEPLLLTTFVENALKHGNLDQQGAYVKIDLSANADKVIFHVINTYAPNTHVSPVSGIGLDNVKRRLELIYPSRYKLAIDSQNWIYRVELAITLAN